MNRKKLITLCLCVGLCGLTGCTSKEAETPETLEETRALTSGDYGATLPFVSSNARQQHSSRARSLVDTLNLGTGLLNYSKTHFSSSKYTMQEGKFLAYDELSNLLGREREANPDGLNPKAETPFETGNGSVIAPVIIRDIYEINFMDGKEMAGLSLGIVMNGNVSEEGKGETKVQVSDEILRTYGEEAALRLVTYMRKMPEIGDSTPIYVMLYKDGATDATLPGVFFAESYVEGKGTEFSSIDESWALFPSATANQLDATVATQFTQVKNALNGFFPEDVNIIGKGKFQDKKLSELRISVNMYAKTATEAISLTQYINAQLSTFSSLDYKIQVEIHCQDEVIATMVRNIGEKSITTNMLI